MLPGVFLRTHPRRTDHARAGLNRT
jgi:hypothetical protein